MKTRYIITLFAAVVFLASCDEKQEPSGGEVSDNVVIPELPDDPQPENTSFAHRIMLLQHTGTYCPNCPRLMSSLKELSEDDDLFRHFSSFQVGSIACRGILIK